MLLGEARSQKSFAFVLEKQANKGQDCRSSQARPEGWL